MTSFYECRSSPRVTDGSRSQVQGQRALSTWASPLRHNLTPPPCVVTASCVIRTPMFRLRDERHTDTYQNMLLTELIDQFCGCGDITGWILQRRNKNGQTLEFNNNKTDCWNILINNTNNNTTSSFVIRVIVTNLTPIKDQWVTQTGWTFNRTTSLSLHTFCHLMMEMDGCIFVILWTRLMHPASNHLLPVDLMCEILTKEWNSKFFCLSWRKLSCLSVTTKLQLKAVCTEKRHDTTQTTTSYSLWGQSTELNRRSTA